MACLNLNCYLECFANKAAFRYKVSSFINFRKKSSSCWSIGFPIRNILKWMTGSIYKIISSKATPPSFTLEIVSTLTWRRATSRKPNKRTNSWSSAQKPYLGMIQMVTLKRRLAVKIIQPLIISSWWLRLKSINKPNSWNSSLILCSRSSHTILLHKTKQIKFGRLQSSNSSLFNNTSNQFIISKRSQTSLEL